MVDKLSVASLAILLLAGCPPKQPAGSPVDQPVDAGVDQAAGEDGASSPVAEPPEQRVQGLLSEAEEAVQAREPARLQPILEEMQGLARQFPDVAALHYDIGVVYEALNDRLNARKAYLRATDLDPSLAKAWLNLGALAEESGDLERAWRAYEAGRSHAPDDPDLVVGQIGVLRKQGRTEEAIALARQALGQNANNIGAYNNLGLVYLDQGNVDLANFIYQKALNSIEGADSNAYLHCNLGRVYKAMDKEYLAQQEFDRALQLDPELVAAMLFLGDARLDNHDWEGAAELLERARDLEPDNPAILVNLGIAYRGLGRFEEAAALYKRALELDPGNPDPYLNLAVLQGDHMRAYDAALASVDAYLAAGGTRTELAAQWRADLEKSREKYERELERKRRRAEREKQREEEARLAAEHEARQAAIRAAAEAALGQACPAEGCPELTVCNRAGVCAEPGSPGTAGMGDACSSDDDCVAGLGCGADAVCVEQAAPGAAEETEAAPGAAEETEAAPVDGSPWGEEADTASDPAPVDTPDAAAAPDNNPEESP